MDRMDIGSLDFNYFDAVVAATVLILGIKGMLNGFIKELFGLAGLVGGVYVASRTAEQAGRFISDTFYHFDNPAASQLVGFVAVLAIVWIVAVILGALFSTLSKSSGLGPINHLLGFITGGGKYFLIFALIVTALSNVTLARENLHKYVKDSILYPYLVEAGSYLINLNPNDLLSLEQNLSETPATTPTTLRSELESNATRLEHNGSR
jgi:membrane protein required for colicin V production